MKLKLKLKLKLKRGIRCFYTTLLAASSDLEVPLKVPYT